MSVKHFASVGFIDDIPVTFGTATRMEALIEPDLPPVVWPGDGVPCSADPWDDVLAERLGDRWRVGEWEGEYPLVGHMLIASLALHEEYVTPIIKELGLL